jgi:hypothetical protein
LIAREQLFQWRRPTISGISGRIVSGLCVFAAALGLYIMLLKPWGAFDRFLCDFSAWTHRPWAGS